jgi:integral membrane protein
MLNPKPDLTNVLLKRRSSPGKSPDLCNGRGGNREEKKLTFAGNYSITTSMLKSALGRLRLVALSEGISFLLLLAVGMPLKYFAGLPEAVKILGWIHGLLFMWYLAALTEVSLLHRWAIRKIILAFSASLVPFGPFLLDPRLKQEQKALEQEKEAVK